MSYPSTDILLVCFSVVHPGSFSCIKKRWIPQIKEQHKNIPFILVGTRVDLRDRISNAAQEKAEKPISKEQGEKLAKKIGALSYIECSALSQFGLKSVFDTAVFEVLEPERSSEKKHSHLYRLLCGGRSNL